MEEELCMHVAIYKKKKKKKYPGSCLTSKLLVWVMILQNGLKPSGALGLPMYKWGSRGRSHIRSIPRELHFLPTFHSLFAFLLSIQSFPKSIVYRTPLQWHVTGHCFSTVGKAALISVIPSTSHLEMHYKSPSLPCLGGQWYGSIRFHLIRFRNCGCVYHSVFLSACARVLAVVTINVISLGLIVKLLIKMIESKVCQTTYTPAGNNWNNCTYLNITSLIPSIQRVPSVP